MPYPARHLRRRVGSEVGNRFRSNTGDPRGPPPPTPPHHSASLRGGRGAERPVVWPSKMCACPSACGDERNSRRFKLSSSCARRDTSLSADGEPARRWSCSGLGRGDAPSRSGLARCAALRRRSWRDGMHPHPSAAPQAWCQAPRPPPVRADELLRRPPHHNSSPPPARRRDRLRFQFESTRRRYRADRRDASPRGA